MNPLMEARNVDVAEEDWLAERSITCSDLKYQTDNGYFGSSFELLLQRLNLPRYQTKQIYNLGKRRPSHDELVEPFVVCSLPGSAFGLWEIFPGQLRNSNIPEWRGEGRINYSRSVRSEQQNEM